MVVSTLRGRNGSRAAHFKAVNPFVLVNDSRTPGAMFGEEMGQSVNSAELALLDSIVQGDRHAMKALYELYLPRIARFLHRVTRDTELIQELTNDVMMAVWRGATEFRRESSVSTWILGIAYRKGLDAVRSRKRYGELINSLPEPLGEETVREGVAAQRDLDHLLSLLSPEQRAVAELSFDFGYSYPEIAEILDIPVNTVKTRMFYARQTMQASYNQSSEEE